MYSFFIFLFAVIVTTLSEATDKHQTNCSSDGQFLCSDGSCIDNIHVCDGYGDCWYELYLLPEQTTNVTSDEAISLCINQRCPKFTFQCAYGACIDQEKLCDGFQDCHDNSDEDEEFCLQRLEFDMIKFSSRGLDGTCEAFSSPNLILNCTIAGYYANCNNVSKKGTKMTMRCKNGFHKQFYNSFTVESVCLENGNWSPHPRDDCTVCGRRYRINDYTALISYAQKAKYLDYPWHAGLYEKENNTIKYICGGSIIHPKAILTAAHCVYDEWIHGVAKKTYFIAVGKYYSSWDYKETLEERQEVKKVHITQYYRGLRGSYEQDIAILELEHEIKFHPGVSAVCIDWGNNLNLYQNPSTLGTVVGWGNTEYNVISDVLKTAKLRFYDFVNCREMAGKYFEIFITPDKICAGLGNGTIVQQGDSGGSLTFSRLNEKEKEENYIYGVVSFKDDTSNNFGVFTKVGDYLGWIEQILKSIIEEDIKSPEEKHYRYRH